VAVADRCAVNIPVVVSVTLETTLDPVDATV
jgi:hypothetical protein